MSATPDEQVAAVRAFNRFYTAYVGALGDHHLDSPYALTDVRVLYEVAAAGSIRAADLVARLGLDPSYLSRLVTRLESDELITRHPSGTDGRSRELSLTAAGRKRFEDLDRRAVDDVRSALEPLSADDRAGLLSALATVRSLLDGVDDPGSTRAAVDRIRLRDPRPGELGWVVQRHGALYAAEYGWDRTFESLVASIVGDFAARTDDDQRAWVADLDGAPVGFVMCTAARETTDSGGESSGNIGRTAQLRLLLVEPSARGLGVGGRLVETCVEFARSAGYGRIILWTNDPLTAARRIYERAGFSLVAEEPHTSFGAELIGQYMTLDLGTPQPEGASRRE